MDKEHASGPVRNIIDRRDAIKRAANDFLQILYVAERVCQTDPLCALPAANGQCAGQRTLTQSIAVQSSFKCEITFGVSAVWIACAFHSGKGAADHARKANSRSLARKRRSSRTAFLRAKGPLFGEPEAIGVGFP